MARKSKGALRGLSGLYRLYSARQRFMLHINFWQLIGRFIPFYGIADGHLLSSPAHPFSFDKNPFPEILHVKYGFLFLIRCLKNISGLLIHSEYLSTSPTKRYAGGHVHRPGFNTRSFSSAIHPVGSRHLIQKRILFSSSRFVIQVLSSTWYYTSSTPRPHRISPISILLVIFFDR
jgi:hypothetical protein